MNFLQTLKNKEKENSDKFELSLESTSLGHSFTTTKEQRNQRIDICKSCEHLFKLTSSCKKCGCFMTAKTWLASAKCPINKW